MAKSAKALKAEKEVALPHAVLLIDGQECQPTPEQVVAVLAGWSTKQDADAAKVDLDLANAAIIEQLGEPCSLVIPGICRASYSVRESVKVSDPAKLDALLGDRFEDLVNTTISYKPAPKLLEMVADGDNPLQPALANCLTSSNSESVTWRAEK